MSQAGDRLFALLPVVHRQRDEEPGGPLRALFSVIAEQVDIVEQDIARLYENWFIETCDDWVMPYLGDLVGYRLAPEVRERGFVDYERQGAQDKVFVSRREVANTLRYRRRKGSLALLEFLANDVAGWPARAVEFYRLVAASQGLKHHGMPSNYLVDLRFGDDIDRVNTPFDELPHTVDVRRLGSHRSQGLYNPTHVGLFVWRVRAYPVRRTEAAAVDAAKGRYRFDAFGHDVQLYTLPVEEPEPTHIADETNLPVPIRRRALRDRLADYYGEGKSFCIWAKEHDTTDLKLIDSENTIPADLSNWSCPILAGNQVAVDPQLGRLLFTKPPKVVRVSYHYGFSADIGGGEYPRPIRQPSFASVSLFHKDDIKTSALMLRALKEGQGALALYIRTQLSDVALQLLTTCEPAQPPAAELLEALTNDLNRLLRDEHLYEEDRFRSADADLRQKAKSILDANPQWDLRLYANRLLLEAVYSDVVKGFRLYKASNTSSSDSVLEQLERWSAEQPRHAVIEITESGSFVLTGGQISLSLDANRSLHIRAANAVRPVIHGRFNVTVHSGSRLVFDGLLIDGNLVLKGGDETAQADISLRHCTVMSGEAGARSPGLVLTAIGEKLVIESSIVGPLCVSQNEVRTDPLQIAIVNSVVDAGPDNADAVYPMALLSQGSGSSQCRRGPGGSDTAGASSPPSAHVVLSIERSTILGQVRAHAIDLAKNTIFTGRVHVDRRQRGEMRFCYVPQGSRTPSCYECQPGIAVQGVERRLEVEMKRKPTSEEVETAKGALRSHIRPSFTSRQHGAATYCQLALSCPQEIVRGADDEGEMGVFHDLHSPQRLANLEVRLNEYVPAGMEAGVIVAS